VADTAVVVGMSAAVEACAPVRRVSEVVRRALEEAQPVSAEVPSAEACEALAGSVEALDFVAE
jgi:hypothetical protein